MDLVKHLLTRHYDPTRYTNQVLDFDNEVLTVYLTNLCGQLVGYQQYRPNVKEKRTNHPSEARYFTHTLRGVNAVWGLEALDPSQEALYVVEGLFKASSLHMLGLNAVAALTSSPKPLLGWLRTLPYDVIAIGDADKAGEGLVSIIGKGFTLEKDIDEYDLPTLQRMLSRASRSLA